MKLKIENRKNKSKIENRKSKIGNRKLEIGNWNLDIGYWILEIANRKSQIANWKLEIEYWKLEIGYWKLEIGNWKVEIQNFLVYTNVDYHFWFRKYSPIFNFKFDPILGLFGSFGANFGFGVKSKKFFGTFLHRLTTFILDVQPYL